MNQDPNYGRLLANRYQLAELVGEGAMGRVYRAKDTLLGGVTVAIKFLSQTLLNDKMRERFEREATICALLGEKSIHVVRVRDYGVDEHKVPFYVMEFLSGESMGEIIRYQPLELPRFLTLTRHICLGLESAHQGILFNGEISHIIHRDIKPSNIVVVQDPTLGELAKILDFGIAKLVQASAAQTQSFMGTLAYCSPEQMEGKELDNRSDIYSLGVMMYEMLTGNMPLMPQNSSFGGWYQAHHEFHPESFSSNLNLPRELQELVYRCLAKSREARPQSVAEVLEVLEKIQQSSYSPSVSLGQNKPKQIASPQATAYTLPNQDTTKEATIQEAHSITEICLKTSWPKDKPVQKIVFARLIPTELGLLPCLSVMLDYQDLVNRLSSTRYNQFLFISHPHPMLLWITLLYNRQHGPRWLPCYLDLKTEKGQKIANLLGDIGSYRILFFALDRPDTCQNVMKSTINPQNSIMLKQWVNVARMASSGQVKMAKRLLKQEFEQLKPKILLKLEAVYTDYPSDVSG